MLFHFSEVSIPFSSIECQGAIPPHPILTLTFCLFSFCNIVEIEFGLSPLRSLGYKFLSKGRTLGSFHRDQTSLNLIRQKDSNPTGLIRSLSSKKVL